jgi:hypothetical protein
MKVFLRVGNGSVQKTVLQFKKTIDKHPKVWYNNYSKLKKEVDFYGKEK